MIKQVIANCDPLKSFKEGAISRYNTCSFFEHDVNQAIDTGIGEYQGNFVREKIITDGKISLQRKNPYSPKVVWQNALVTLESGLSISIDISGATFMVDVIRFGDKVENEIHVVKEDKATLQRILNLLYHEQQTVDTQSISFKSPTIILLESMTKEGHKQEELDLIGGYSKTKHRRGRRY